jgi:hypothetical protein
VRGWCSAPPHAHRSAGQTSYSSNSPIAASPYACLPMWTCPQSRILPHAQPIPTTRARKHAAKKPQTATKIASHRREPRPPAQLSYERRRASLASRYGRQAPAGAPPTRRPTTQTSSTGPGSLHHLATLVRPAHRPCRSHNLHHPDQSPPSHDTDTPPSLDTDSPSASPFWRSRPASRPRAYERPPPRVNQPLRIDTPTPHGHKPRADTDKARHRERPQFVGPESRHVPADGQTIRSGSGFERRDSRKAQRRDSMPAQVKGRNGLGRDPGALQRFDRRGGRPLDRQLWLAKRLRRESDGERAQR